MDRARIAVVGAGRIGARHIEEIVASAGGSLSAIVDMAPAAATLAKDAGVPLYASLAEMLARERPDGIVWGGAIFSNSFGQPSAYAFGGQRLYRWSPWDPLYAEWTAGLLYGYRGEYKHKVPFNYNGFSPGITVGVGWRYSPAVAGQVNLLGTAGLMFLFTYELP